MAKSAKLLCVVSGGIGDEILTIPAVRYLRHALPDVSIEIMLGGWRWRRRLYRELLGDAVPIRSLEAAWRPHPAGSQEVYDWILEMEFTSSPGGVPDRIQTRHGCFSLPRPFDRDDLIVIEPVTRLFRDQIFELAHRFVCGLAGKKVQVEELLDESGRFRRPLVCEDRRAAGLPALDHSQSRRRRPRLAVTPGGRNPPAKRWPLDRFALVIRHVLDGGTDVDVLCWDEELPSLTELPDLVARRSSGPSCIGQGRLRLIGRRLPGILRRLQTADVHVGNDTAYAHVAGALDLPQVVLYLGADSPHLTLGLHDTAVFSGDAASMEPISVEAVIGALERLLPTLARGV